MSQKHEATYHPESTDPTMRADVPRELTGSASNWQTMTEDPYRRPVVDDLREKVLAEVRARLAGMLDPLDIPSGLAVRIADAVLAVVDPDGYRDRRVEAEQWRKIHAERDAAVREAAALRAGVEALAVQCDGWANANDEVARSGSYMAAGYMKAYQQTAERLRALLADPTPEADRD